MRSFFLTCFFIVWVFFISACTGTSGSTDIITPAKKVIERQIGDRVNGISFQQIDPVNGKETFEIEAKEGKLTLRGSSVVALCYAFHIYQREACHAMTTWGGKYSGSITSWPDYSLKKQTTPYEYRYFLNVCTYGYTTPYWDWARWEKEIDWMALRGVNMPLATVASEAIAERVWLQMGLTKEEIREFFTAPAHLPWHRMGNLNTWDGPLSDEWQESQIQLQHQIINRMRELGMSPIAPAFAGFVPIAFAEKHPDIKFKHLKWGGFDDKFNAYVLPPDSPFSKKSVSGLSKNGKKSLVKIHIIYQTVLMKWNCLLQKTMQKVNISCLLNMENQFTALSQQVILMQSGLHKVGHLVINIAFGIKRVYKHC